MFKQYRDAENERKISTLRTVRRYKLNDYCYLETRRIIQPSNKAGHYDEAIGTFKRGAYCCQLDSWLILSRIRPRGTVIDIRPLFAGHGHLLRLNLPIVIVRFRDGALRFSDGKKYSSRRRRRDWLVKFWTTGIQRRKMKTDADCKGTTKDGDQW